MGFDSGRWRLPQLRRRRLLFPGGGSFFSFAVVGSSLRGVKATTVLRAGFRYFVAVLRVWVSIMDRVGLVCLSCVGALTLSDEISKSDEALRRVDRVGRTEMVSAEALRVLSSDEMKLR